MRKVAHPNAKKMHFPTWDLLVSKSVKNQGFGTRSGGFNKKSWKSMVNNKNKAFGLPAGSESFENPSGRDFGKTLERFWKENPSKNLAKC